MDRERVRAHVVICMLAAYLVWRLRQAWAPLTFTDEHRPDPLDPVAPAQRSKGADAKAATKTTTDELPATSFTALLDHLGCLAGVDLCYGDHDTGPTVPTLAEPTATQRRVFELLGADPTDPDVARTPHRQNDETPAHQEGFTHYATRNFGLTVPSECQAIATPWTARSSTSANGSAAGIAPTATTARAPTLGRWARGVIECIFGGPGLRGGRGSPFDL
jgi:hypothetical protein